MIHPELMAEVQRRVDSRRSASSRRRRMRAMMQHGRPEEDLSFTLEWIALSQNVSVARAAELLIEKLADGSLGASGRRQQPDGSIGARETVPAEFFRGHPH